MSGAFCWESWVCWLGTQNYSQNQKYSRQQCMAFPFIGERQFNYLHSQLQRLKSSETEEQGYNNEDTQNRACSSLCELSDNICLQQVGNESAMYHNPKQYRRITDIRLSPWKNKNQQDVQNKKVPKDSFCCKSSALSMVEKTEMQRCRTENKENIYQFKGNNQYSNKITKINSIFFKKVQPKEKKILASKPQQPQIEFIALMCKKSKYSMEINEGCILKEKQKGNITQPLINKSFTPKILNLYHLDQQNEKENEKKSSKNMIGGWSEDIKQQLKNVTLVNEHWKAKSFQSKSKKNKKVVLARDTKSTEARDVRENVLWNKRGSLSVGKQRKGEYKSSNPLTRLLYQKYLHTIGANHPTKDFRNKYL